MPCLWNLFRILRIQWTYKDQEHNLFYSSLAFGEVSNIKKKKKRWLNGKNCWFLSFKRKIFPQVLMSYHWINVTCFVCRCKSAPICWILFCPKNKTKKQQTNIDRERDISELLHWHIIKVAVKTDTRVHCSTQLWWPRRKVGLHDFA